MNTKRYENFTEFFADFHEEFSRSENQRLVQFINTIATLGQGCGCTRRQRTQWCSVEYHAIGEILQPINIQLMKMKFPMTRFEFAEAGHLFYVIEV